MGDAILYAKPVRGLIAPNSEALIAGLYPHAIADEYQAIDRCEELFLDRVFWLKAGQGEDYDSLIEEWAIGVIAASNPPESFG
jgi:hypothetical protein